MGSRRYGFPFDFPHMGEARAPQIEPTDGSEDRCDCAKGGGAVGCARFERLYNSFSDEKQNVLYFITGGQYYCPYCRQIHQIEFKERETHEQVQK